VVELAERVGRDYTTVSRQVAKLASLALIERRASASDRRVSEATIKPAGKAMTDRIDRARRKVAKRIFQRWEAQEFDELIRLMGKFAAGLRELPRGVDEQ
jgi:DNA-binding MarR family transcriptional regulator